MNNYNNFQGYNVRSMQQDNKPPAFSVLEENIEGLNSISTNENGWSKMYETSLLAPSPVVSPYAPNNQFGYDSEVPPQKFEPRMSQEYEHMIKNNKELVNRNKIFNMSPWTPEPLPEKVNLPTFTPPMNTPYPSAKYSAYDAELAANSETVRAFARPSVPIATMPALLNAPNEPSIPLQNPQFIQNPLTIEQIKSVIDKGLRENYHGKQEIACSHAIRHTEACPYCIKYMNSDIRLYKVIIAILIILVIILLCLIGKKK